MEKMLRIFYKVIAYIQQYETTYVYTSALFQRACRLWGVWWMAIPCLPVHHESGMYSIKARYYTQIKLSGTYCFCPVCVFFLSVANFNISYNFWTVRDRDFIFCMHTQLMMPFQITLCLPCPGVYFRTVGPIHLTNLPSVGRLGDMGGLLVLLWPRWRPGYLLCLPCPGV